MGYGGDSSDDAVFITPDLSYFKNDNPVVCRFNIIMSDLLCSPNFLQQLVFEEL